MNYETPADEIQYTPHNAIRLSIRDLRSELSQLQRKGDPSEDMAQLIGDLIARITALEEAQKIVKAAEAMKTALKGLMDL